jgi:phospholipid/cholesterol/gamma-HCH transport system substrate-binding protein
MPNPRLINWTTLRNLGFALVVLLLAGFAVGSVASRSWQWQPTFHARAAFHTIAGVESGARVLVQGMNAGVVESVQVPDRPGGSVVLVLRLDEGLRHLVRSDATVRIVTQGVVGSKVVEIVPGQPKAPALAEGAVLRSERPLELADLLKRAERTFDEVDATASAARQGLTEATAVVESIRKGQGTLGRLVQDDEAYRRMLSLSERGEDTLVDLQDNLAALKGTWPISGYFNRRGFTDSDRLLYQPGARREQRVLAADALFEPGRAVLTPAGRKQIDEVAQWFKSQARPDTTRVVVAAFTDTAPNASEDLARILTQDQADAIRNYLVGTHALDRLPWYTFSKRSFAAVGFGTHQPAEALAATAGPPAAPPPGRRVEVILFTPQES